MFLKKNKKYLHNFDAVHYFSPTFGDLPEICYFWASKQNLSPDKPRIMIHLRLPGGLACRLPFYLAMEEWAATCLPANEYFFSWVVDPTVIIGRNQDLMTEVNLDYCRRHGIDVCRRRSGGGCVYADCSNIMLSYICPSTDVASAFGRYTDTVVSRLRAMGIMAEATGRNDITVDGRKISGSAFYRLKDSSIAHGTMLYDIDAERMLNAITPSRAKLESHKVQSVESRITMARTHRPDLSFDKFCHLLSDGLTTDQLMLTAADIAAVQKLEQRYYEPSWILHGMSAGRSERQQHISGVGMVAVSAVLDDVGRIDGIDVVGDAFVSDDFDCVVNRLRGCRPLASEMAVRLGDMDVSHYIAGLSNSRFIDLVLT